MVHKESAREALQGYSDVERLFYGTAAAGSPPPQFGRPDEGAPDPEDVGHAAHAARPLSTEEAVARALRRNAGEDAPA